MIKGIMEWGKRVGPKVWSSAKESPSKVKSFALDAGSKIHRSEHYKKATHAMSEMSAMSLRDVGRKLTTKTGIGITAGVGAGTAGYMAGKKKKNKRYT